MSSMGFPVRYGWWAGLRLIADGGWRLKTGGSVDGSVGLRLIGGLGRLVDRLETEVE